MPAIPLITAAAAVGGVAVAAKGVSNANKAAEAARNTPAPTVDIPGLQTQAQNIALQNAQNSAAIERQYNPGAAELRSGSIQQLINSLNPQNSLALQNYAKSGAPGLSAIGARPGTSEDNAALLAQIRSQAGQPLTTNGFDSALTRAAVAKAQSDLALGGQLPLDVRNLIARQGLAKSGTVTQGLGLGRDITARDLGLTSLDIERQRLAAAAQLGSQEAGLEQANAAMRAQAEQFGRNNLLQSQSAFANQDALAAQNYATDAQIAAQRDALASSNYFNQASLLQAIQSGDFSRAFQAAQFGQSIAQPTSGIDPGSVANIAIGNTNATAAQQQNAQALAAQAANQQTALGGQLLGAVGGFAGNYFRPSAPVSAGQYFNTPVFGASGYQTTPTQVPLTTSSFLKG